MSRVAPAFVIYERCTSILPTGEPCQAIIEDGSMSQDNGVLCCPVCTQPCWLELRPVEVRLSGTRSYAIVDMHDGEAGERCFMMCDFAGDPLMRPARVDEVQMGNGTGVFRAIDPLAIDSLPIIGFLNPEVFG